MTDNESAANDRRSRPRLLSGMRPTGSSHLGHLVGAYRNWEAMQDEFNAFYCIVDWHALTTDYRDTADLKNSTLEIATDWLAVGLDPKRCNLFIQSQVPEHAELHLLLSMVVPLGWLERVPTYKELIRELKEKDLHTYGFLGYPVLQAADILMYDAAVVPVGEDQKPHVELTREIARRFNSIYGPVLTEPAVRLTPSPRLPGTDGRKMSKSYGNVVGIAEDEAAVRGKLRTMMTDPARKRLKDPGDPGEVPGVRSPSHFFRREDAGLGGGGLPLRRDRLHPVQERVGGQSRRRDRAHRRAPAGVRKAARRRTGRAGGRAAGGIRGGGRHHGAGCAPRFACLPDSPWTK